MFFFLNLLVDLSMKKLLIIGSVLLLTIIVIIVLAIRRTPNTEIINNSGVDEIIDYSNDLQDSSSEEKLTFNQGYNEFVLKTDPTNPSFQTIFSNAPTNTLIIIKRAGREVIKAQKQADGWSRQDGNLNLGDIVGIIIPENEVYSVVLQGQTSELKETQTLSSGLSQKIYLNLDKTNFGEIFVNVPNNLRIIVTKYIPRESGTYKKTDDGWIKEFGDMPNNPMNIVVDRSTNINIYPWNIPYTVELEGRLPAKNQFETASGTIYYVQIVEDYSCLSLTDIFEKLKQKSRTADDMRITISNENVNCYYSLSEYDDEVIEIKQDECFYKESGEEISLTTFIPVSPRDIIEVASSELISDSEIKSYFSCN